MFDGPTAGVVISAILTTGAAIIVALVKLVPWRGDALVKVGDGKFNAHLTAIEQSVQKLASEFRLVQELDGRVRTLEIAIAVAQSSAADTASYLRSVDTEVKDLRREFANYINKKQNQ